MTLQWARGSRKHKIGRAHAQHVINTTTPQLFAGGGKLGDDMWRWVGVDDRGLELEIVAIAMADALLVIHVMPTAFRRGSNG